VAIAFTRTRHRPRATRHMLRASRRRASRLNTAATSFADHMKLTAWSRLLPLSIARFRPSEVGQEFVRCLCGLFRVLGASRSPMTLTRGEACDSICARAVVAAQANSVAIRSARPHMV
jgi:hypothetical protein